jgi:L-iditol 2-dehydrogenase
VNDLFWRNEVTLTSSYGGSPGDYAAALELIQAGKYSGAVEESQAKT